MVVGLDMGELEDSVSKSEMPCGGMVGDVETLKKRAWQALANSSGEELTQGMVLQVIKDMRKEREGVVKGGGMEESRPPLISAYSTTRPALVKPPCLSVEEGVEDEVAEGVEVVSEDPQSMRDKDVSNEVWALLEADKEAERQREQALQEAISQAEQQVKELARRIQEEEDAEKTDGGEG